MADIKRPRLEAWRDGLWWLMAGVAWMLLIYAALCVAGKFGSRYLIAPPMAMLRLCLGDAERRTPRARRGRSAA